MRDSFTLKLRKTMKNFIYQAGGGMLVGLVMAAPALLPTLYNLLKG
jgi:hypothetical protein